MRVRSNLTSRATEKEIKLKELQRVKKNQGKVTLQYGRHVVGHLSENTSAYRV